MAVIYRDTTTKYELSWSALKATANQQGILAALRSFVVPVESAINEGINLIGSGINTIVQTVNVRRKDEQAYLLAADESGYNQENNMLNIVLIIVLVIGVIYMGGRKKK